VGSVYYSSYDHTIPLGLGTGKSFRLREGKAINSMSERVILVLERVIVTVSFLAFLAVILLSGHTPQIIISVIPSLLMLIAGAWFMAHSQVNGKNESNLQNNAQSDNVISTVENEKDSGRIPPGMGAC
jgi:ABC-type bacteriocin/lantibiotic exporter with double-glycine peptidase domain